MSFRKIQRKKRQDFINKTNSVIDDVKTEVRYMSVTMLDWKDRLGTEIVPRDKRYEEMETKQECISLKTIVQNLTDFRMDMHS